MLADPMLRAALDAASVASAASASTSTSASASTSTSPLELTLYLTVNPCHYSSSNSAASCTDNLLRWQAEILLEDPNPNP